MYWTWPNTNCQIENTLKQTGCGIISEGHRAVTRLRQYKKGTLYWITIITICLFGMVTKCWLNTELLEALLLVKGLNYCDYFLPIDISLLALWIYP